MGGKPSGLDLVKAQELLDQNIHASEVARQLRVSRNAVMGAIYRGRLTAYVKGKGGRALKVPASGETKIIVFPPNRMQAPLPRFTPSPPVVRKPDMAEDAACRALFEEASRADRRRASWSEQYRRFA